MSAITGIDLSRESPKGGLFGQLILAAANTAPRGSDDRDGTS